MDLDRYWDALGRLDGATMALIGLMCTLAAVKVRQQMANVVLMTAIYPFMLAVSVAVYVAFFANDMFNPKKMADWLVYVVAAGSIGSSVTIVLMAGLSRLWERSTGN